MLEALGTAAAMLIGIVVLLVVMAVVAAFALLWDKGIIQGLLALLVGLVLAYAIGTAILDALFS